MHLFILINSLLVEQAEKNVMKYVHVIVNSEDVSHRRLYETVLRRHGVEPVFIESGYEQTTPFNQLDSCLTENMCLASKAGGLMRGMVKFGNKINRNGIL